MQIKAVIHEKYTDTEIHVCNSELDDSTKKLIRDLDGYLNQELTAVSKNGDRIVLSAKDICRFYANDAKVFAQTSVDEYIIPQKLYEIEKELDETMFLRISKSEIINLKKIQKIDMSVVGTIKVYLIGEITTYTSRRNVSRLKAALGI